MPDGFRRHLVGKTLRNVCHRVVTEVRFFREVNDVNEVNEVNFP